MALPSLTGCAPRLLPRRRACTWLSIDGGFSWVDIAEGTFIYEYAGGRPDTA
jgi:hypothetical protein